MSKTKWLQISDLHFGIDGDSKTIREGFLDFVQNKIDNDIHYLFVTGDIIHAKRFINKSESEQQRCLQEAKRFIKEISNPLKIPNECIFIVPGNHDVSWGEDEQRKSAKRNLIDSKRRHQEELSDDDLVSLVSYQKTYIQFCESFTEDNKSINYCQKTHEIVEKDDIDILLLNTALTATGEHENDSNLLLGTRFLSEALNVSKDLKKTLVVLAHHSPEFFAKPDQDSLARLIKEINLPIILCGHAHHSGYNDINGMNTFVCGTHVLQDITDKASKSTKTINDITVLIGEIDHELEKVTVKPYKWTRLWRGKSKWIPDKNIGTKKPYDEFVLYSDKDFRKILEAQTETEAKNAIYVYLQGKITEVKERKSCTDAEKVKILASKFETLTNLVISENHHPYWSTVKDLKLNLGSRIKQAKTLDEVQVIINGCVSEEEEIKRNINNEITQITTLLQNKNKNEYGILLYSKSIRVMDFLKAIDVSTKQNCIIYVCAGGSKSESYVYQDAEDYVRELSTTTCKASGYNAIKFIPDLSFDSFMKGGKDKKIDIVLLGASLLFHNGTVFTQFENTVGSNLIIAQANKRKIPCFIIAGSEKFKHENEIESGGYGKAKKITEFHNLKSHLSDSILIQYPELEVYKVNHAQVISDKNIQEYLKSLQKHQHSKAT